MTIFTTMMSSITSSRVLGGDNNQLSNNPFDDFVRSRGRSGRTGSLALPNNSLLDLYDKQQEQCSSLALIPPTTSIRRHSSHYCPMIEDKQISSEVQQHHQNISSHINQHHQQQQRKQVVKSSSPPPPLNPPPVPKRTFKGKFMNIQLSEGTLTSVNNTIGKAGVVLMSRNNTTETASAPQRTDLNTPILAYNSSPVMEKHQSKTLSSSSGYSSNTHSYNNSRDIPDISTSSTQYTSADASSENANCSDDDRMSLENSVFEEPSRTTELGIMYNSQLSQRSSSESNKSQATADTGYMSIDNDRGVISGAAISNHASYSIDNRNVIIAGGSSGNGSGGGGGGGGNGSSSSGHDFRSRFSSVDTQSSLDSCLTEKTIDSPISKDSFRIDYDTQSCRSNSTGRTLPAVPARKQNTASTSSVPSKIPPPNSASLNRQMPPIPPLRSQISQEPTKFPFPSTLISPSSYPTEQQQQNFSKRGRKLPKSPEDYSAPSVGENQSSSFTKSLGIRNKLVRANKPPPITHPKLHQRQDSSISSDSYSMTSSPGYNCKSMEAPLLQHASKINKSGGIRHQNSNDSFNMTPRYNFPSAKLDCRQDSNVSSDSFSQTSSPGYINTKVIEPPLIPHSMRICNTKQIFRLPPDHTIKETEQDSTSPITKSASTPASLQTIVRFQNGSNMSLQHRIVNRRKSSNPYVTQGRLKFRLCQILLNAVALLAIAGGLAAYFNAYPTVKFINKTNVEPQKALTEQGSPSLVYDKNPVPGVCLPVIVKFCHNHHLPYNYTVFPNYIGHFGQPEAQVEIDAYDAMVDVRCYDLVALFLCTLFVPKCGLTGATVPPCKTLCTESLRRCGFFLDVFGLQLPEYLDCSLFVDSMDPNECVGLKQVIELREKVHPACSGFLCDSKRCIPSDWRCDGHVDCQDQTDELNCDDCDSESIYCGEKRCMSQKHVCDGVDDCPWGQDERNCIRLSERNGDLGKGMLEVYKADIKQWTPACVAHWDASSSPSKVCSMLGYSSVNSTKLMLRGSNMTLGSGNESPAMWRMYQKRFSTTLKQFSSCPAERPYPVVELTCTNYECGKVRRSRRVRTRIIGGTVSEPGEWPFLAAILGGPEEVFYCAGVLIADQWVLTASHCIGNHTIRSINDWTIQLGITRRHSHAYYGQKVKVQNVIPHPQYNAFVAHDNDIALFQLATRVAFHEHLSPVCLPPLGLKELKPGTLCTVIGWGKREDKNLNPNAANASYEPTVNQVNVPVLNRDLCNEWLEALNVTDGMICAGYQEGGKDACQGDSGGPLLCPHPTDRDRWFVGGIVSWGIMCAHPRLPGVYANVPKYIPWIAQQMQKYSKLPRAHHDLLDSGY